MAIFNHWLPTRHGINKDAIRRACHLRLLLILFLLVLSHGSISEAFAETPSRQVPGSAVESPVSFSENDPDAKQLRKVIESLCHGTPNYEDMEPPLAALIAEVQMMMKVCPRLGNLEAIDFLRKQKGERVYDVWFANGRMVWGIGTSPSGKISWLRFELLAYR